MPLTKRGKKVLRNMKKLFAFFPETISTEKMLSKMTVRAKNLKIFFNIIGSISILMMTYKYFGIFVKSTFLALFHFLSGNNMSSSNFIGILTMTPSCSTFSTTKCSSFLISLINFPTKFTSFFLRPFTHSFKLAFSTATMLFATAWYGLKFFSTNLAFDSISRKFFAPTPTKGLPSTFFGTMLSILSKNLFTSGTLFFLYCSAVYTRTFSTAKKFIRMSFINKRFSTNFTFFHNYIISKREVNYNAFV